MQTAPEAAVASAAAHPHLGALTSRENFQADRRAVFPSPTSLDWFIRRHKKALIEAGALVFLSGRLLVNPSQFDAVSMEIGRQEAIRRGGGL